MQIKTKIVSCHTADSNPVKQEVDGTVILPPFSIPWLRPQKILTRLPPDKHPVAADGSQGFHEVAVDELLLRVDRKPWPDVIILFTVVIYEFS